MNRRICWFDEIGAGDALEGGGKAANLGEVTPRQLAGGPLPGGARPHPGLPGEGHAASYAPITSP